jgi:hypothetical protein
MRTIRTLATVLSAAGLLVLSRCNNGPEPSAPGRIADPLLGLWGQYARVSVDAAQIPGGYDSTYAPANEPLQIVEITGDSTVWHFPIKETVWDSTGRIVYSGKACLAHQRWARARVVDSLVIRRPAPEPSDFAECTLGVSTDPRGDSLLLTLTSSMSTCADSGTAWEQRQYCVRYDDQLPPAEWGIAGECNLTGGLPSMRR